jgi:predicted nucleotidyltransferase
MIDKETIVNKLREIKPLLAQKYTVTEIALFGSYSREEQHANSDIDIMVSHVNPLGFKYFDLVYEIKSLFDIEVQVVSRKAIKPGYFEVINKDLIYA